MVDFLFDVFLFLDSSNPPRQGATVLTFFGIIFLIFSSCGLWLTVC